MKFLKKLAFNLIRDDIENVLKAHDKAITDHYYKIIDDVEDILKTRNEEIKSILEEKLNGLDAKSEEIRADLYSEMQRLITRNSVTARDIANEIDTKELLEDLAPVIAAKIDYSVLYKMSMVSLAKWAEDNS
jgi:uncharacterized protein YicC (UPF0701 family)